MSIANALGMMRHLYAQMVGGHVKNPSTAAEGLLAPAIKEIERVEAERAAAARASPDVVRGAIRDLLSLAGRGGPTHWTVSIPLELWDRFVAAQRAPAAESLDEAALAAVRELLQTWEHNRASAHFGDGAPGPLYVAGMAAEADLMIAALRAALERRPAP